MVWQVPPSTLGKIKITRLAAGRNGVKPSGLLDTEIVPVIR